MPIISYFSIICKTFFTELARAGRGMFARKIFRNSCKSEKDVV